LKKSLEGTTPNWSSSLRVIKNYTEVILPSLIPTNPHFTIFEFSGNYLDDFIAITPVGFTVSFITTG
jgi:hypothetical protein